jgi:hypothetical protein
MSSRCGTIPLHCTWFHQQNRPLVFTLGIDPPMMTSAFVP